MRSGQINLPLSNSSGQTPSNQWNNRANLHFTVLQHQPITTQDFLSSFTVNYPEKNHFLRELADKIHSNKYGKYLYIYTIQRIDANQNVISQWPIKKTYHELKVLIQKIRHEVSSSDPNFPKNLDPETKNNGAIIATQFSGYLAYYLNNRIVREKSEALYEFLELSSVQLEHSFIKFKDSYVKKKASDKKQGLCATLCSSCASDHWPEVYLIITQDGLLVLQKNSSNQLIDMHLFELDSTVHYGIGLTGLNCGVTIIGSYHEFYLDFTDYIQTAIWLEQLKEAQANCPYLDINRHLSFAPLREKVSCRWFIGGEDYCAEVYDAINAATTEIIINDWFLSPELYLKRPVPGNGSNNSRLDWTLKRAADRGVKIFVMIYHEPMGFYHDSSRVQKVLEALSPNIKVIRHPGLIINISFWSHHMKMITIDNQIGFMGGLDLCFGRFDNSKHSVIDQTWLNSQGKESYWPGKDYYNERLKGFSHVDQYDVCVFDKSKDPRMPWQDVAIRVEGSVVRDIVRNFTQYWNFICFCFNDSQEKRLKKLEKEYNSVRQKVEARLNIYFDHQSLPPNSDNTQRVSNPKQVIPISPRNSQNNYRSLIEQTYLGALAELNPKKPIQFLNTQTMKKAPPPNVKLTDQYIKQNLKPFLLGPLSQGAGTCKVQMCRSAGNWSLGLKQIEPSIHTAYIEQIQQAKYFILIENQYFISSVASDSIKNSIAAAIILKIQEAAAAKKPFKVMVFLPLFIDDAGSMANSSTFRYTEKWIYNTINRGGNSVLETLAKDPNIKDPSDYISFFGLRNHAKLKTPVTEEIYVHAKTMIVDDRVAIIGSANINDRSMLGTRDSEIAMVIEDNDPVESKIAGQRMFVSKFAYTLRCELLRQHTGLGIDELRDPLDMVFLQKVKSIAAQNTQIYRTVFRCLPDDNVAKFSEIDSFQAQKRLDQYDQLSVGIKGNIVEYPNKWVIKEELNFANKQIDSLLPTFAFT